MLSIISTNNNIDNFNWKFLFNLPINHSEKIYLVVLLNFISGIPLLFFIWTHASYVSELFDSEYKMTHWLFLLNLIAFSIILSLGEFKNALVLPRRSMQKFHKDERILDQIVSTLYFFDIVIILFLAIHFSVEYKLVTPQQILKVVETFTMSLRSEWNLVYFTLSILVPYRNLKETLKNEKLSYINPKKFSVKINSLILLAHLGVFYGGFKYAQTQFYQFVDLKKLNSPASINQFVNKYKDEINDFDEKDLTLRELIIKSGNYPLFLVADKVFKRPAALPKAKDGFNEYYYAIMSGNEKMISHFESLGYNLNTKASSTDLYPIHIALEKCHVETIKSFLTKKIDISIRTKEGESLLHYAIKNNCILGVLVLDKLHIDKNLLTKKNEDWKAYLKKYNTSKHHKAIIELNLE